MQVIVPAVKWWLENHYEVVSRRSNNVNMALKEYVRLKQWLTPTMMAHIATTVVLDAIGRGTTFKTSVTKVTMEIGRH